MHLQSKNNTLSIPSFLQLTSPSQQLSLLGLGSFCANFSRTTMIINNIYRGATSINQFVNSATAGNNNSHNGTLNAWTDVTLGRQANESWNGDIAEIIVYNVEVNSAQRMIVDNYLSAKYGLVLSSSDMYTQDNSGNGNFDFEVAGIGRVDASNVHSAAQGSGVVRMLNPSSLGNDEFLLWGHDNGSLQATNVTDVPLGVQGRMARTWRVNEISSSGTAVDVGSIDVQFDLSGLGSVTASDLRLLVDANNNGIFTDETAISGASLISGSIYQFAGVTAITNNVRFSVGTVNKSQTPLPVELLKFSGSFNEQKVNLAWTTATEKNNDFFKVQRSLNVSDWETIGTINGAGNSSTINEYNFRDEHPYNLLSYYRLEQWDFDGRTKKSPIIKIDLENKLNYNLEAYPNPTADEICIQGSPNELEDIAIMDLTGKAIDLGLLTLNKSNGKLLLTLKSLTPGIYFLRSKSTVLKIVRM